jgi:hypothetical protein
MLSTDLTHLASAVKAMKDNGDKVTPKHLDLIYARLLAYACDARFLQNAVLSPAAMAQTGGNVIPFAPPAHHTGNLSA